MIVCQGIISTSDNKIPSCDGCVEMLSPNNYLSQYSEGNKVLTKTTLANETILLSEQLYKNVNKTIKLHRADIKWFSGKDQINNNTDI